MVGQKWDKNGTKLLILCVNIVVSKKVNIPHMQGGVINGIKKHTRTRRCYKNIYKEK